MEKKGSLDESPCSGPLVRRSFIEEPYSIRLNTATLSARVRLLISVCIDFGGSRAGEQELMLPSPQEGQERRWTGVCDWRWNSLIIPIPWPGNALPA